MIDGSALDSNCIFHVLGEVPIFQSLLQNSNLQKYFAENSAAGKSHDQGDAKWIVIRRPLRGHNDTPFGRPTPCRSLVRPRVGRPQGVIGGFSYY
jgi:hypothetical protein